MNGKGVRKNCGGRMIFGDEKLTPLRIRSSAKSSKLHRPKICTVGCEVLRGVCT